MMVRSRNQFFSVIIGLLTSFFVSSTVFAQLCSPGIPCTTYEVDTGANASKSDNPTCDGDFMNQMHARALLEAQRENMMNQVFVVKPDSVLEYSCFGEMARVAAYHAPQNFSESEKWNGLSIQQSVEGKPSSHYPKSRTIRVNMGKGHIEQGLKGMVMDPLKNYIQNNFGHAYLGDSNSFNPGVSTSANPLPSIGTSIERCSRMATIWHLAKCTHFAKDKNKATATDPFLTFAEIAEKDPRQLITACNNTDNTNKITETMIKVASNPAPKYETFSQTDDAVETTKYPYVKIDGVRHPPKDGLEGPYIYSDPLLNEGEPYCSKAPIPTGMMSTWGHVMYDVNEQQIITRMEFVDAVCPQPFCYYNIDDSGITVVDDIITGVCSPIGDVGGYGGGGNF